MPGSQLSFEGKGVSGSGKAFGAEIRIEGLEETIAAMRAIEPQIYKAMMAEIRVHLSKVTAAASASVPAPAEGKYVIRSRARGKKAGMSAIAADKYSAIFEFAGTKMRSRSGGPITPQGAAMVRWLSGFGAPGRFLWGAWDRMKGEFDSEMRATILAAEKELQTALAASGQEF
jgi:hypothetical protein